MATTITERRRIYAQRKKEGCCPRCGKKLRKTDKFTFCDGCRAFFRSYCNDISEKLNQTRKDRYDQRKENNQCPRCGKRLGKTYAKTICPVCLEKQYKYNYNKDRPQKARTASAARTAKSRSTKASKR